MKAIVCLPVDFRFNSLGLPSLLSSEIDDAPVLYHAVSRLTLSSDYRVVLLFADGPDLESDMKLAREILSGLDVEYHHSAAGDVANRSLLRRARLWSINSWRGGLGATSYYDEAGSPGAMLEAADRLAADAVGLMTPDSPFADPTLTSQVLAWHYDRIRKARVTVTGVPPGLVPAFVNVDVLRVFAQHGLTLSASMAYKPVQPQRDLIATEAHFEADLYLRLAPWRLTVHSPRQLEMMRALLALGLSPRSARSSDVVRALAAHPEIAVGAVPSRIEIEPCSRTDAAPFYLRDFAASRRPADMPLEKFRRIVQSIHPHNDVVLSLEGLGEPLLHPALPSMVVSAREAGFLGVHVATSGRLLDASSIRALSDARLDVLSVLLAAHSPDSYRRFFGADRLHDVQAAIDAAVAGRKASGLSWPLVVAEIPKVRSLEADIEPFFDYWLSRCDWPVIRPYNDFAGQLADEATIHMRTSSRIPCRKIMRELYIDADCQAYPCRQDIHRTHPLGDAAERGIPALWRSEFMEQLRAAHSAGNYDFFPLCRNCKDWYHA